MKLSDHGGASVRHHIDRLPAVMYEVLHNQVILYRTFTEGDAHAWIDTHGDEDLVYEVDSVPVWVRAFEYMEI